MSIVIQNINKLTEIKEVLQRIPADLITQKMDVLSGATIGQHFRHIIEFYSCIENGLETGIVSYDERERNILIENCKAYSIGIIDKIILFISLIRTDCMVSLKGNYSSNQNYNFTFDSSLYRELAYAMDHTVHHLAIIKIALNQEKVSFLLDINFGVAPSTVRYRKDKLEEKA